MHSQTHFSEGRLDWTFYRTRGLIADIALNGLMSIAHPYVTRLWVICRGFGNMSIIGNNTDKRDLRWLSKSMTGLCKRRRNAVP